MKVVVTGKNGVLSSELQKINMTITALDSINYDVADRSIVQKLSIISPDIIIHAAAATNSVTIKNNPLQAIQTNIVGTANIAEYCLTNNKRLIYISTDYVYPGKKGDYREKDPIFPHNEYAWTKLGGECSARLVPNHLIIRTSFGANDYPNEYAWDNLITSKDYVDVIAPMIQQAALSEVVGIINIGTEPKSVYDYAARRNKIKKGQIDIKKNFSLNLEKYEQSFINQRVSYNRTR
jgi:dTDP-4-dehydrorhamnose reductase